MKLPMVARLLLLVVAALWPGAAHAADLDALAPEAYVETRSGPGLFPLVENGKAATIVLDESAWPGVRRAAKNLQGDIHSVTGVTPDLAASSSAGPVVIIGTAGKSELLDALAKAGKIDLHPLAGKWESFFLQVVQNPLPGVPSALVIAGSDKRGTIYGVYDLSENIGVSPWHFWADVAPQHQDALVIKPGVFRQGEPAVKYRGIFLNDEAPDLTNWVREKYGSVAAYPAAANYNSDFYEHVFDLLLRLKANYLWPAMWNNAFNEDDPLNAKLADEMGIVMGTSHQEPMLRAQKEWDRRHRQSWNYYQDAESLQSFWKEGLARNKDFESILTLGLRGANDTPMIPNGSVDQSMALLKDIIAAQRGIIADTFHADPATVPQLWCPYKEVLEYYNRGFRVPDDVTILWTDDNWGNLRRIPTADERSRPGGAGIYYHFDYVGGPRNYKWINTNSLANVWQQMTFAREYGASRIWIVNVGHLRGLELPIDYFMHLGWEGDRWTNDNIRDFTRRWAQNIFGADHAGEIADLLLHLQRINSRRKPELLEPTTYSLINDDEAERVLVEISDLAAHAQALYNQLPEQQRDAFYQLVLFPAQATAQVNALYIDAGKNALYARQGRASANDYAAQSAVLFKADADLMSAYNGRNNGRWDHFMDQVHIGYTSWQDPPRNVMPKVQNITPGTEPAMGVAVEGSADAWPAQPGTLTLPRIDLYNRQQRSIDLFNRGQGAFTFSAQPSAPWITLSKISGQVEKDERLRVGVDFSKAPAGVATGTIAITSNQQTASIQVEAFNPAAPKREELQGFVDADGVVSIEAEHFTREIPVSGVRWAKIEDYGRTLSGMTPLPMTAPSITATQNAPRLEYGIYFFEKGSVTLHAIVGPTLNVLPDRGLRIAAAFDEQPPQILTIVPQDYNAGNGNRAWETAVKDNARTVRSTHTLDAPGEHTLKIWMIDPGVVLEKLVIDTGGLKPTYLGPPETFHGTPPAPKP